MKSVRFSEVVEHSGRPQVHALWIAPEEDPEFQRVRKADRVMTIEPRGHGKADCGVVGFDANRQRGSQILVFPKSLKRYDGREVVGIKFDLVEQPATESGGNPAGWKPPERKRRGAKPRGPQHATKTAREPAAAEHPLKHAPRARSAARHVPPASSPLLRAVHAALEELREGKAVAAYQRLERAAADAEASDPR